MILKVYLQPTRDIELIALLFNPTINFAGIAKQALRAFIKGENYRFEIPQTVNYVSRSLVCCMNFDENADAEIIAYMNELVISKSAFVRNVVSHAVYGDLGAIYQDHLLKQVVDELLERQSTKKKKTELEKRLKGIKDSE